MTELKKNESLVRWTTSKDGVKFDDGVRSFTVSKAELDAMVFGVNKARMNEKHQELAKAGKSVHEARFYGVER